MVLAPTKSQVLWFAGSQPKLTASQALLMVVKRLQLGAAMEHMGEVTIALALCLRRSVAVA